MFGSINEASTIGERDTACSIRKTVTIIRTITGEKFRCGGEVAAFKMKRQDNNPS